jgi:hypothetical protein
MYSIKVQASIFRVEGLLGKKAQSHVNALQNVESS